MTLQQKTARRRSIDTTPLLRALFVAAAVVSTMLVLTALFGVQQAGPSYDILPDPAQLSGLRF